LFGLQVPLQHSLLLKQLLPLGRQHSPSVPPSVGGWQMGVLAPPEQQSFTSRHQPPTPLQQVPLVVQPGVPPPTVQQSPPLPPARHLPPRPAHWQVPAQLPLQHCALTEQAVPKVRQQLPPMQVSGPQQNPVEQVEPSGRQHWPPLHTPPEQHGSPAEQELNSGWQHAPFSQLPR